VHVYRFCAHKPQGRTKRHCKESLGNKQQGGLELCAWRFSDKYIILSFERNMRLNALICLGIHNMTTHKGGMHGEIRPEEGLYIT
jgi:hypothetical protein